MKLNELGWNGMKWINEGLIAMEWNELNWNKYGILMMIDEHMSKGRVEFKIWKMIELLNEWTIEWMHQSLSRSLTSDLDVRHRARSCLGRGCQETGNFPRGACFFFSGKGGPWFWLNMEPDANKFVWPFSSMSICTFVFWSLFKFMQG